MRNLLVVTAGTLVGGGATDFDNLIGLADGQLATFWNKHNVADGTSKSGDVAATASITNNVSQLIFAVGNGAGKAATLGLPLNTKKIRYNARAYNTVTKASGSASTILHDSLIASHDNPIAFKITITPTSGNVAGFIIIDQTRNVNEVKLSKQFESKFKTNSSATAVNQSLADQVVAYYGSSRVSTLVTGTTIDVIFKDSNKYKCIAEAYVDVKPTSVVAYPVIAGITYTTSTLAGSTAGAPGTITLDTIKYDDTTDTSKIIYYLGGVANASTIIGFNSSGKGSDIVALERELSIQKGNNNAIMANNLYSEVFKASASKAYHIVDIFSENENYGAIPSQVPFLLCQTIAIDATTANGDTLFADVKDLLDELVAGITTSF